MAKPKKANPREPEEAAKAAEVAPPADATADSGELLDAMWAAQVRALLTILQATDPVSIPAATLATIQRFLSDNGVNAESVESKRRRLADMRKLEVDFRGDSPTFYDSSDPTGSKAYESQRRR